MSIIASQLVAEVKAVGADEVKGKLISVGESSDQAMNAFKSMGEAGNVASAKLQAAYAKVGEASKRFEVAQAQAALAMQKAQAAAHDDSLSLEQVQVATTKADLAAERVSSAQANVAVAMERAATVARSLATAETQVAEKADMAGLAMRERLGQALSSVSEAGSGFIGRIMGMGSGLLDFGSKLGMTVFGLQMLGQTAEYVGGALLEPNASMEQLTIAFTGLLGSASKANAMLKELWDFAARTPFEFTNVTQDTQELLGMGFAAKNVIPVLTAVGDAAAGVGRGQEGIDRITLALGQMEARGKVTGQDMMQLTEAGIPAWRILADSMHLSVNQVQKLSEQGKLGADSVTALWQGMEKMYGGQMKNQAQTFNGLLSTFKDNISAAWRAFTGPLFDEAKGALTTIGNLVSGKGFQDFATNVGQKVGGALKTVADDVGAVVKAFQSPEFAKLGDTLGRIFGPLIAAIEGPFKSAMQTLQGTKTTDITNSLRQAATAANDFLTALEGFQGGSSQFTQAGQSIRDTAIQIGDATLQTWNIMQQVGAFLRDAFTPAWEQLQVTIQSQIIPSWNDLKNSIEPLLPTLEHLGEAFAVLGGLLVQLFGKVLAYVIQIFGGIVQVVSGAFQAMAGSVAFFVDLFSGNFAQLGPDLAAQWNGIIDIFRGALNILNGITGGALDALLHLFGTSIDQINAKAADMNKSTSKSANDMKKNVVQSLTDMKNQGLEQTSQLTWQASDMFAAMGNRVGIDMANMDAAAKGYWNDVASYIDNHPLNVPLHNQGTSQHYASGTDSAPGGPALVGEAGAELVLGPRVGYLPPGAQVIPHAQTMAMLGGGGGGGGGGGQRITVEIPLIVNGREFARAVVDDIMEYAMRQSILVHGGRLF